MVLNPPTQPLTAAVLSVLDRHFQRQSSNITEETEIPIHPYKPDRVKNLSVPENQQFVHQMTMDL